MGRPSHGEGWFYKQNGERLGPVSQLQLRELVASGQVQPRQAVWKQSTLTALQSSNYAELRKLRCEVTEAVVIVHGVVSSYYLKQMAQTIIQRLEGVQSMMNLVEVRQSE